MPPRLRYSLLCVLSLLLATAAGCKIKFGDDTAEANKLIAEANRAIGEADKMSQEAYTKFTSYMNNETLSGFPSNREQIRAVAEEAGELFGKSAATYREQVVNKFEGASQMNLDDKFKEYIKLKTEAYRKLADSKEVAKELALLPLNPSFTIRTELVARVNQVDARLNAIVQEAQEVNDRANKLQQENPDIIGKPPQ